MGNENLKILLDGVRQNYDAIADADNSLENKAGTLLGIEIAIGVGYLALKNGCLTCMELTGMMVMVVSIGLLIFFNWPKKYFPPSIFPAREGEYRSMTEENLLLQSLADTQLAIKENRKKLNHKARLYKAALILLILSAFLLIL